MKKIIAIIFTVMITNSISSDLHITTPLITDAPALQSLNLQLGYDELSEEIIIQKIKLFSSGDVNKVWVAKFDNKIVGLITLTMVETFFDESKFARIDSLVVSQQCRGLGVGKKLIKFAEEYAKRMGCKKIFLSCSNRRIESHIFYKTIGYIDDSKYFVKYLQ